MPLRTCSNVSAEVTTYPKVHVLARVEELHHELDVVPVRFRFRVRVRVRFRVRFRVCSCIY